MTPVQLLAGFITAVFICAYRTEPLLPAHPAVFMLLAENAMTLLLLLMKQFSFTVLISVFWDVRNKCSIWVKCAGFKRGSHFKGL